jgi:hypothetical protein
MGQFDSLKSTLPQPGLPGISDSDRGIGLPDRREPRPMYVETKKKDKPKTAAAGGGSNPPKNPPKGPTGPKNPDKGNYNENKKNKSLGGLTKGKTTKSDDKMNPRKIMDNIRGKK